MIKMFIARIATLLVGVCLWATGAQAQDILHTEASKFSPVVVYEARGERCIAFGSVQALGRQTCYLLDDPKRMVFNYTRMMMASLFVKPDPARILIIGLGGGTLPTALAALLPDAQIDTVEIDPAVVSVASRYFGFVTSPRQRVHQADGRAYVEQAVREGRQYDLIMLDAFDYTYIPAHLMTREFLLQTKALLAPEGVLAANTFSTSQLYDRESATYADVFGEYFNLRANNRVILATNGALPDDAQVKRQAAAWAQKMAPYGIDVSRERDLFSRAVTWPAGTPVLRD